MASSRKSRAVWWFIGILLVVLVAVFAALLAQQFIKPAETPKETATTSALPSQSGPKPVAPSKPLSCYYGGMLKPAKDFPYHIKVLEDAGSAAVLSC